MSTLADAGLAKVVLTYLDGGTLRAEVAVIPADQLARLLAQLHEAGIA
jgi:Ser/Thr protein kinase RdoA (MazF antagonist)